MQHDLIVIGGGLIGLATAYQYLRCKPGASVAVLEKDHQVAGQQSGHNSGVLHAGLYYRPGSAKARLSVKGLKMMVRFCRDHQIRHELCGKIVLATAPDQIARLKQLWQRGHQNGLTGLKMLKGDQMRAVEPHARGLAAIHVPQEGIVDYAGVAAALTRGIRTMGGQVVVRAKVNGLEREQVRWRVSTVRGDYRARQVVGCAGLHSDRIAQLSGGRREVRIIPFRGEYYTIRPKRSYLVRNLIYPVPDPSFPFLGVHFTRLIDGGIEAGPNAVLAMAREGYRKTDLNLSDMMDALTYPGLWRFMARYPKMTLFELYRSLSKQAFCRSLQRLVPEITLDDLGPGGAGVRAQAMYPHGALVEDFHFVTGDQILHVVNAPSPGATACLAIGEEIVQKLAASA